VRSGAQQYMREFKCLWKKFEAQNDSSGGVKIRPPGMRRHQTMTLFLVIPRLLHYEESKTVPMYETTRGGSWFWNST
jgi:hypothetical protein